VTHRVAIESQSSCRQGEVPEKGEERVNIGLQMNIEEKKPR